MNINITVYHDEIQVKCNFDYNTQIFGEFFANGGILITGVIALVTSVLNATGKLRIHSIHGLF